MAAHAGGELCITEDKYCVKTAHESFDYISVYNDSADTEKSLSGIEWNYEILIPDGVRMKIDSGEGELKKHPPASVAFIHVYKKIKEIPHE